MFYKKYLFFFTWYKHKWKTFSFLINNVLIEMHFIKIKDQLVLVKLEEFRKKLKNIVV